MVETIVCKFGGTSLADAACFRRVGEIIRSDPRRRYIIVSAPGRMPGGSKVTDLLISARKAAGSERRSILNEVRRRFCRIAADLGISPPYSDISSLGRYANESESAIASRGEYLSAKLLSQYLNIPFVDSAEMFSFQNGTLDTSITYRNLRHLPYKAVIPGFYGADPSGKIVTFPRGGSDITAAHVSAAIGADLYENMTDVNGFFTADPSVIKEALHIPSLSCAQARLFAYLGAGVLHYDSIAPAADAGIPIAVKNTFSPQFPGTLISSSAHCTLPCIAFRKNAFDYTLSCANLSPQQAQNVREAIPRNLFICEYGSVISTEISEKDLHALARKLHNVCIDHI